jgi:hypothetical protein
MLLTGFAVAQPVDVDITRINLDNFPEVRLHLEIRREGVDPIRLGDLSPFVQENGTAQGAVSILCPDDDALRLSVAVLLDRSGSMARTPQNQPDRDSTKMRRAKEAISGFLDFLTPRDEGAVFSFTTASFPPYSHIFRIEHDFSLDIESLKGSLVPLTAVGGTRIWQAVIDAVRLLRQRSGRKILILVTDGRNTLGNEFREQAVRDAVNAEIPVYSIGIGGDVDVNELSELAALTGGRFFDSPDSDGLEEIFKAIADEVITDECVLKYISTNPCPEGSKRLIDVQLSGGGAMIDVDTFYYAPDRREVTTLVAELPAEIVSRSMLRVPLVAERDYSLSSPLSYSIRMDYDPALLRWLGYTTEGTVSEGLNVIVRETAPGQLAIDLAAGQPLRANGPLLELDFEVYAQQDVARAAFGITQAFMNETCPLRVLLQPDAMLIQPCEERYTIGGTSLIAPVEGGSVSVPLYLEPLPAPGDRVLFSARLFFDSDKLKYDGINPDAGFLDGNALVLTDQDGVLDITIDGVARYPRDAMLVLRFIPVDGRQVVSTELRFGNHQFASPCRVVSDALPIRLMIDGICEPLLRRVAVSALSSYPNPVSESGAFTFTLPDDSYSRLRLVDAFGRDVHALLDAWLPAGEHHLEFDVSSLPPGEYYGVLESATGNRVRKIVILR